MFYELKYAEEIKTCCACNAELVDVPYVEAVTVEVEEGLKETFSCCSEICAMTLPHLVVCVHGESIKELV